MVKENIDNNINTNGQPFFIGDSRYMERIPINDTEDPCTSLYFSVAYNLIEELNISFNEALQLIYGSKEQLENEIYGIQGNPSENLFTKAMIRRYYAQQKHKDS